MSSITPAQFNDLTVPLKSMTISHAWRGYGSAVFIELGELTKGKGRNPSGKATLMLEWSWRVEGARSIAFGSFSSDTKIESGLQGLVALSSASEFTGVFRKSFLNCHKSAGSVHFQRSRASQRGRSCFAKKAALSSSLARSCIG